MHNSRTRRFERVAMDARQDDEHYLRARRLVMATIGTRIYTILRGEFVGRDEFDNRYYRAKHTPAGRREKRWVLYESETEASRVPPSWHGWLHHIVNHSPTATPTEVKSWEKPHLPNLTGTSAAYRPPCHILQGGQRDKATGDYEPWRPE